MTMTKLAMVAMVAVLSSFAFTAEQPVNSDGFARLIQEVQSEGKDNYIRPNIGPMLGLDPNAPSKAFVIDVETDKQGVKLGRSCNLVKGSDIFVFLHYIRQRNRLIGRYFKCAADGKLLSAIEVVNKAGKDGKVIQGSGVKTDLDVSASKTKKSLAAELDFWLSGAYKKHLPKGK